MAHETLCCPVCRFGGSAAVTSLKGCSLCLAVARAEEQQRQFELSEFKLLHAEESGEMNDGGDRWVLLRIKGLTCRLILL